MYAFDLDIANEKRFIEWASECLADAKITSVPCCSYEGLYRFKIP